MTSVLLSKNDIRGKKHSHCYSARKVKFAVLFLYGEVREMLWSVLAVVYHAITVTILSKIKQASFLDCVGITILCFVTHDTRICE